jgi:hypothetical protein
MIEPEARPVLANVEHHPLAQRRAFADIHCDRMLQLNTPVTAIVGKHDTPRRNQKMAPASRGQNWNQQFLVLWPDCRRPPLQNR